MDPYAGFAGRYDLYSGAFGEYEVEEIEFFRQVFNRSQVRTILDCACGTGRVLPLFHSLGCEVTGSDVSESMLAQARANLAEIGLDVSLLQTDFRSLPALFNRTFDAVVCLAAIGFMANNKEFIAAFESMNRVLRPGGILILSAMPTDQQWRKKPRFMLVTNNPDFSRLFIIDYLDGKACFNVLDIFHGPSRNEILTWKAELTPLLRDEQEKLLKYAGFQSVDFYGDFDFTPYDKAASEKLITVAVK